MQVRTVLPLRLAPSAEEPCSLANLAEQTEGGVRVMARVWATHCPGRGKHNSGLAYSAPAQLGSQRRLGRGEES